MNQKLKHSIRVLFNKVQFSKTCHKNMETKLKGYYEQVFIGYVVFIKLSFMSSIQLLNKINLN